MSGNSSDEDSLGLFREEPEADDGDFSSDSDEEYQLPNEEESDESIEDDESVSSDSEIDERNIIDVDRLFVSKDNTVWSPVSCQHQNTRARNSNIIALRPGKLTCQLHWFDLNDITGCLSH